MKLTLGFSPCPNDTFIFDAIANKKIETDGLDFEIILEDVQTLNEWALSGKLDITKLSYGVLPGVLNHYAVLTSGSALGNAVGPLLIANNKGIAFDEINDAVAIPGKDTTAHLLFSMAYPRARNKIFLGYNEIEDFVLAGKGAGVIIHENRFTYMEKGLHKIVDLGDYWEQQTGNPIPLGGICIKRSIDHTIQLQVDQLIKQSIEYAFGRYPLLSDYVKSNAQEMSEEVMRKHINLYVNEFSLDLKQKGKQAIHRLLEIAGRDEAIKENSLKVFVR